MCVTSHQDAANRLASAYGGNQSNDPGDVWARGFLQNKLGLTPQGGVSNPTPSPDTAVKALASGARKRASSTSSSSRQSALRIPSGGGVGAGLNFPT